MLIKLVKINFLILDGGVSFEIFFFLLNKLFFFKFFEVNDWFIFGIGCWFVKNFVVIIVIIVE